MPSSKPPVPLAHDKKGYPIFGYNTAGKPICGAKRKGGPCQCPLRMPNGRCKSHGGMSTGPAIKHGGRSKAMETFGLAEKFVENLVDPQLVSSRGNVALIETLIQEAMEGGVSLSETWESAIALHAEAMQSPEKAIDKLAELGTLLRTGLDGAKRLDKAVELAEKQRKHIEAENRREAQLQHNMSVRESQVLIARLLLAVKETVRDPAIQREIGLKFAVYMRRVAD